MLCAQVYWNPHFPLPDSAHDGPDRTRTAQGDMLIVIICSVTQVMVSTQLFSNPHNSVPSNLYPYYDSPPFSYI